jgi:septal ring-binding cell division protein DamX
MPDNPKISPAVESMKKEQARQRSNESKGDLDKALEDTFPASDPISTVASTAATGGPPTSSAGDRKQSRKASVASRNDLLLTEAPRVDEALDAIDRRDGNNPDTWTLEELHAMRSEISRMRESLLEVGSASGRLAKAGVSSLKEDAERRIRERPFAAVGVAALLGYFWGLTR